MSDKQWRRDRFDVLMTDDTEHLGVLVNYSDRIRWAKYADERKETGATDWRVDTAGVLWCALRRHGRIAEDVPFHQFSQTVANWERSDPEPVNPTEPAP